MDNTDPGGAEGSDRQLAVEHSLQAFGHRPGVGDVDFVLSQKTFRHLQGHEMGLAKVSQ